ncbi:hypothetical protein EGI26_16905 [Lacihabitans sp. CCS-44]|uniref:hypothetical protein n=1 Tax=Lacihabitans sp. CCS-44 TaxID=2487331 RepID=UPI0020CE8615|nr:hypothetical protein [Lacihabitans sp. CCS-44]MCP9756847.1 hypothetical protein [Lacihabitans sp. CCS-44]
MKKLCSYILVFSLILCKSAFAQENLKFSKSFLTNIFIHTSKPSYLSGEKIWLSAYLFNTSNNRLLEHTHPLYLQLYAPDGKLVLSQTMFTNGGRGSGTLALLPSTAPGVYRLRAFTQNMVIAKQDPYEKQIYVGIQPLLNLTNIEKPSSSNFLKVSVDSTLYARRSAIKLFFQSDDTLEASLSISVHNAEQANLVDSLRFSTNLSAIMNTEQPEQLLFMGRAIKSKGSFIKNGQVVLLLGQQTFMAKTDSTGFFIFTDLNFEGEQTAYWQINNAKGKAVSDARIHWIKFPKIPNKIDSLPLIKETTSQVSQTSVYISDGDSLSLNAQLLEELTVRGKRNPPPLIGLPTLHKESDVSFSVDFDNNQLPNGHDGNEHNFYKMLKYFLPACRIGSDPPKYLLDGVAVDRPEELIDTRQIKRIELLRGANAMIYRSTCVYVVYTHGVEKKSDKNIQETSQIVNLKGYQQNKTFYMPSHEVKNLNEQDNRQTLYWNPELTIDAKQKHTPLQFYTSDLSGKYKVIVQGISNLGPIYSETSFIVK